MSRIPSLIRSLTLCGAAGLFGLGACAAEPEPTSTGEEADFVFGLSEADIVSLYDLAPRSHDLDTWIELHRAPLSCGSFGTLCDDIGPQATHDIMEQAYLLALGGAGVEEIDAFLWPAIDAAERDWEAAGGSDDLRASTTRYFYNGSNNKRLKIKAKATSILLTTRLKAGGWCKVQTKTLGVWASKKADDLDGELEATFGPSGLVWRDVESGTNVSELDFDDHDEHADDLTTEVSCEADLGAWTASGSATAVY